jgi:hypothetical protein
MPSRTLPLSPMQMIAKSHAPCGFRFRRQHGVGLAVMLAAFRVSDDDRPRAGSRRRSLASRRRCNQ